MTSRPLRAPGRHLSRRLGFLKASVIWCHLSIPSGVFCLHLFRSDALEQQEAGTSHSQQYNESVLQAYYESLKHAAPEAPAAGEQKVEEQETSAPAEEKHLDVDDGSGVGAIRNSGLNSLTGGRTRMRAGLTPVVDEETDDEEKGSSKYVPDEATQKELDNYLDLLNSDTKITRPPGQALEIPRSARKDDVQSGGCCSSFIGCCGLCGSKKNDPPAPDGIDEFLKKLEEGQGPRLKDVIRNERNCGSRWCSWCRFSCCSKDDRTHNVWSEGPDEVVEQPSGCWQYLFGDCGPNFICCPGHPCGTDYCSKDKKPNDDDSDDEEAEKPNRAYGKQEWAIGFTECWHFVSCQCTLKSCCFKSCCCGFETCAWCCGVNKWVVITGFFLFFAGFVALMVHDHEWGLFVWNTFMSIAEFFTTPFGQLLLVITLFLIFGKPAMDWVRSRLPKNVAAAISETARKVANFVQNLPTPVKALAAVVAIAACIPFAPFAAVAAAFPALAAGTAGAVMTAFAAATAIVGAIGGMFYAVRLGNAETEKLIKH